jgi:putative chitinase
MARHQRVYTHYIGPNSLKSVCPNIPPAKLHLYARALGTSMHQYNIDTPARAAKYIATLAHESVEFRYSEEIASGAAYEGRNDLGNIRPGDGKRYKGRGWIQLTGRANYERAGKALGMDLINNPERVSKYALRSAQVSAWWWSNAGCNQLADKPGVSGMLAVTKRVNGGTNGWLSRLKYYYRARKVAKYLVPRKIGQ